MKKLPKFAPETGCNLSHLLLARLLGPMVPSNILHTEFNNVHRSIAASLAAANCLEPVVAVTIELAGNLRPISAVVYCAVHLQASEVDGTGEHGKSRVVHRLAALGISQMLDNHLLQQGAILGPNVGAEGVKGPSILESKDVGAVKER